MDLVIKQQNETNETVVYDIVLLLYAQYLLLSDSEWSERSSGFCVFGFDFDH